MALFILMNNFLHDLAAAIWICGSVLLWLLSKEVDKEGSSGVLNAFFRKVFKKFSFLTLGSLVVIILGGIVRTAAYRQFEWIPAVGRGQVVVLIIKHILFFLAVAVGLYFQLKLARKVKGIESELDR